MATHPRVLSWKAPMDRGTWWATVHRVAELDRTSLIAQLVKNLPAMRKTCVQSTGEEDPLEKGKAAQSSILAWRSPCLCSLWGVWVRKELNMAE